MTNTIPNVPRELLEDCLIAARGPINGNLSERLRAILSAPSPAGVDGLEVVGYSYGNGFLINDTTQPGHPMYTKLVRLSDAQAIIDGLRGEVEELIEARDNRVSERLAILDQQAQRIGELEGLLYEASGELRTDRHHGLRPRIDAALSAGKEGE